MIDPKLKNVIISVVTGIWALNFLAGLAVKGYQPDQAINAIFMGIVGGLFALGARDKKDESNNGDSKGESKGDPK